MVSQGNAKVPMTFNIYKGEELLRTETLAQDIIKVGKLPSSHLRIDDDNVSRMHAVIEVTGPDEIFIIDLGSASGTIVNGKKVNKCKLESGDEIQLGDTRVAVEIAAAEAGEEATQVAAPPAGVSEPPAPPAPAPASARPAPPAAPPTPAAAPPVPAAPAAIANPFAAPAGGVPNPFAPPVAAPGEGDGAEVSGDAQYGIVASGPPVRPDEVETGAAAVEVVVMWGDTSVLHVEDLSPPRSFYVGDALNDKGQLSGVQYLVGAEVLGTDRLPVVVEAGGGVAVVIPDGATGDVTVGEQTMSLADLASSGKTQACSELAGAQQYPLPAGATAKVQYKGFTFIVKQVAAGKRVGGGLAVDWTPLIYIGGSLAFFASILIMFYFLPPSSAGLSLELLSAPTHDWSST